MPIQAHLDRATQTDRRRAGRRELRLRLDLLQGSDHVANALVLNISASGLLLQSDPNLVTGDLLRVDLPEAGLRTASVVWSSGEFAGCRFEQPLPAAVVSAAQLRGEPIAARFDNAPPAESFGARIRRLRQQHGLTQPALARLVDVTKLTVWKWERGDARPRHRALQALAGVFGVSESDLLLGEPKQETGTPQVELSALVERCKAEIAEHLGIAPDKVEVTARL